jgi:hypothetical protein
MTHDADGSPNPHVVLVRTIVTDTLHRLASASDGAVQPVGAEWLVVDHGAGLTVRLSDGSSLTVYSPPRDGGGEES